MKITIITPNYNGERYLQECLQSVISQRNDGVELEYIVVDGASKDGSWSIIEKHKNEITKVVREPDEGPTDAINKGLGMATGDIVGWLNADDLYNRGALRRVIEAMTNNHSKALCFGHCPIIDENGREIRTGITRFKEMFFPISGRFTIQCINYISQPAMFFRRSALQQAGLLKQGLKCAWDYDFILRLWRFGGAAYISNPPLAAFRWHENSISGRNFRLQFKEEWDVAKADAGALSLQTTLHLGVRWGIVCSYSVMACFRKFSRPAGGNTSR